MRKRRLWSRSWKSISRPYILFIAIGSGEYRALSFSLIGLCRKPLSTTNLRTASSAKYVFCHNDLLQQNVIVDPNTLKIAAIIDWEYAGFFPEDFEAPFYMRLGPSVALKGDRDDTDELLKFIQDQKASPPECQIARLTLQQE